MQVFKQEKEKNLTHKVIKLFKNLILICLKNIKEVKKGKRFFPWKSKQMNHEFSVHPRLSRFNFLYSVKKNLYISLDYLRQDHLIIQNETSLTQLDQGSFFSPSLKIKFLKKKNVQENKSVCSVQGDYLLYMVVKSVYEQIKLMP